MKTISGKTPHYKLENDSEGCFDFSSWLPCKFYSFKQYFKCDSNWLWKMPEKLVIRLIEICKWMKPVVLGEMANVEIHQVQVKVEKSRAKENLIVKMVLTDSWENKYLREIQSDGNGESSARSSVRSSNNRSGSSRSWRVDESAVVVKRKQTSEKFLISDSKFRHYISSLKVSKTFTSQHLI